MLDCKDDEDPSDHDQSVDRFRARGGVFETKKVNPDIRAHDERYFPVQ